MFGLIRRIRQRLFGVYSFHSIIEYNPFEGLVRSTEEWDWQWLDIKDHNMSIDSSIPSLYCVYSMEKSTEVNRVTLSFSSSFPKSVELINYPYPYRVIMDSKFKDMHIESANLGKYLSEGVGTIKILLNR